MGIKKLIPPPGIQPTLTSSITEGVLNLAEKNKVLGAVLSSVIGPTYDAYKNLNTAAAVAASSGALNIVLSNNTLLPHVNASSMFMGAIATSSAALNTIVKSPAYCAAVASGLQSFRAQMITAMADTTKFTKSSLSLGNGAGQFDNNLNSNTVYIPTSCNDDNDTDYTSYHGFDLNKSYSVIPRHSGTIAVTSGVGLRGTRLIGVGSSIGYVIYDVYTAI